MIEELAVTRLSATVTGVTPAFKRQRSCITAEG